MTPSSPIEHVDPGHAVLTALFGSDQNRDFEDLENALNRVFERFIYQPVRGRSSFEHLAVRLARGPEKGDRKLVLNCYDFSCLFVSHLRASDWHEDEVFVMPCDVLNQQGETAEHFHCCVLLRRDELRVIDPIYPDEPVCGLDAVRQRYRVHMLFNDRRLVATNDEKAKLLEPPTAGTGLRCYLYGDNDPRVSRLIGRPAFRRLARDLFRSGDCRDDPAPSGSRVDEPEDVDALASTLADAQRFNLLVSGNDGVRSGTRLVAISRQTERTLHRLIEPLLERYAAIVCDAATTMRRQFDTSGPAELYSWQEVEHSLVPGVLMDLAVGNRLAIASAVREAQGPSVVWCFENLQAGNAFGVQLFASPEDASFLFQLWHERVERPRLSLANALIPPLVHFARGERQRIDPKHWQYLRFLRLAAGDRDTGHLRIPALRPEYTEKLVRTALAAAEALVADALVPAFDNVLDDPDGRRQFHIGVQPAIARAMLDYATDHVVNNGILSPFPVGTANPAWGRLLWLEPTSSHDPLMPRVESVSSSTVSSSPVSVYEA